MCNINDNYLFSTLDAVQYGFVIALLSGANLQLNFAHYGDYTE